MNLKLSPLFLISLSLLMPSPLSHILGRISAWSNKLLKVLFCRYSHILHNASEFYTHFAHHIIIYHLNLTMPSLPPPFLPLTPPGSILSIKSSIA
mmetsp:Transcript_21892/g.32777  ORF Transcript_21892/g.32777 Transcript_21892/m.32777 type:complete len:95 (+) Transcript_21892:204-488(+)